MAGTKPPTIKTVRRRLKLALRSARHADRVMFRLSLTVKAIVETVAEYEFGNDLSGPIKTALDEIDNQACDAYSKVPNYRLEQLARLLGVIED